MSFWSFSKFRSLVGYGIGDFGLNIYWKTISLYLIYWYTNIVGISPAVAGTIFLIGMLWDAVSDPIVASLTERVRTRHGTYRPFLLFGSFILAFFFGLLFWVPPFDGALLIFVLIVVGIFFRTSYTLVAIPYSAMSSRLTFDSVERTELSGIRMFFAYSGLLLVSLFLPPLVRHFSESEKYTADGFQIVTFLGGAVATIAILLCFFGTTEKSLPPKTEKPPLRLSEFFKVLSKNKALIILLCLVTLQSSAGAAFMTSLVFFIETNSSQLANKEFVLTASAIGSLTAVPIWTALSRSIGRKTAWKMAAILLACLGGHMLIFGPLILFGIPVQIVGFSASLVAFSILTWSIIPDTVEYGQIQSGYRSEGIAFGTVLVVQKLSNGFMGFLIGLILTAIGYDPDGAENIEETGRGLVTFLSIVPPILLLLSILPLRRLPLDRRIHADIVDKLNETGSSS